MVWLQADRILLRIYSPGQGKATIRAVDTPVRGADCRFHLEREEGLPPNRLLSLDRMGKEGRLPTGDRSLAGLFQLEDFCISVSRTRRSRTVLT